MSAASSFSLVCGGPAPCPTTAIHGKRGVTPMSTGTSTMERWCTPNELQLSDGAGQFTFGHRYGTGMPLQRRPCGPTSMATGTWTCLWATTKAPTSCC